MQPFSSPAPSLAVEGDVRILDERKQPSLSSSSVYDALKLKGQSEEVGKYAAQFKVLQDRFRQAARITATGELAELESEFTALMGRMDAARAVSLTAPQRFFEAARKQIEGGNYTFGVNQPK